MKKLMVFDLDGTLNQTESYVLPAMQDALRDFGVTHIGKEEILKTFGARDEDTIVDFFGDDAPKYQKAFWERVYGYVESKYSDSYRAYEGTETVLRRLKEDGWLLAVCSNAEKSYICLTLERLGIAQYMDYIQELIPGKTKNDTLYMLLDEVRADCAIMVGDRFYDRDAARANHIKFAACRYGYGTAEELEGADYELQSPLDLLEIGTGLVRNC